MRPLHSFIRDGQLVVHGYRMLKQICFVTVGLASFVGVVASCLYFLKTTNSYQRFLYQDVLMAQFRLSTTFGDSSKLTQTVISHNSRKQEIRTITFLKNPWVQCQVQVMEDQLWQSFDTGIWSALGTLFLISVFFIIRGYRTSLKKLERGNQIASPKALKRLIRKKCEVSDLKLDNLPLLKNKETSHILITGTTGSGKTNCFHTLLPQIRKCPNRAIIVDLTGDFVGRYYRKDYDILLNPFYSRSALWSPWGECLEEPHYDALAAAVVAKTSASEPFWENASKVLLSSALKELAKRGERNIQRLYDILIKADLTKFSKFFQNTEAASYTHPDAEKMTLSIRATLGTICRVSNT